MINYNKVLEHNKRYEAGEVTWTQGVHPDMDLTEEEWAAKRLKGLPKPSMKRAMIPSSSWMPRCLARGLHRLAEQRQEESGGSWLPLHLRPHGHSLPLQGECH